MRSKTLISYQKGYCGQPADIEAMKPREARAYCLGVGHVAAGTLPFGSGAEVLAALMTRRRDVDGGDEVAQVDFFPGDIVRRTSASGSLTNRPAVLRNIPANRDVTVQHVDKFDGTIMVDTWWVEAEDFALVRRAAPSSKDSPR